MRILLFILLLISASASAQGPHQGYPNVYKHGDSLTLDSNRGGQYIYGTVRLANYATGDPSKVLGTDAAGNIVLRTASGGGGTGTVTGVSVISANGLGGTVANPSTTPAITLTTTVNALVKGNGTAFMPAVAGTDYQAPGAYLTGLTGDGSVVGPGTAALTLTTVNATPGTYGGASAVPVITVDAKGRATTITTVAISGGAGTVTSVSVLNSNGFTGVVSNPTTTPTITVKTTVTGMMKGDGANASAAVAGTDYQAPGNYITALTGDVTASGPGSATATLATVNATPATYGGGGAIPVITVNNKGQATTITTVAPTYAGTVTSVQVVTANGFRGNVGGATTTPSISLQTTVTGILKGDGTAMSAAVLGTDYEIPNAFRGSVRVATTGNLTAAYGGTGVGATLTNSGTQAAIAIDGITLSSGDRVIVWQQSTTLQNGVYSVTNIGSGSTNWVLTRTTDFDGSNTGVVVQGATFDVAQGTANAGLLLIENAVGPFTVGTTGITFLANSANVGGAVTGVLPVPNGGTGVSSFTTGSIPFMGSTTLTQDASNLWWDNSAKELGIGTNAPGAALDVRGAASVNMANFSQSWSGSGSPTAFKIAISDASSGSGKLLDVLGGASGSTSRFSVDRNGNGIFQTSMAAPNHWTPTVSAVMGIRNQAGNNTSTAADGISVFMDRAGTNKMIFTGTSGQINALAIYPTYNQGTGATATNTDLLINRTETSIGTGTVQNIFDFQANSVSQLKLSNTGVLTIAGRINPRDGNTASNATPAINTDLFDQYRVTALTVAITGFVMTGTPVEGQQLVISITGTAARAITWGASFEASTVALPTTTVTTNMLSCHFMWNSVTSKWRITKTW
jgi:hypothetical protein